MYFAYELNRTFAQPLNFAASVARTLYRDVPGLRSLPGAGPLVASMEMVERATRRYDKPAFGLTGTVIDGSTVRVTERTVLETPFCHLLHFEREGRTGEPDPKVLVVAPLSGHYATLVRDLVRELLPAHDVYVTDWVDARLVRRAEGAFGLHDFIDVVATMIRRVGPRSHVIAVCQPCPAVLAAVSCMAEEADPLQPASMTLMSGPIDARVNPTRVGVFAADHSVKAIERTMVHRVPPGSPGFGRRVYPGVLQLQAFLALDPARHLEAHGKHFFAVARGDETTAGKHRTFYDEYFAVMDLPAEFYLETVGEIFQQHLLPRGEWKHHGTRIRPEVIESTALLTVEGGKDDITAPGQTAAAARLCTGLPAAKKRHHLEPDVGHYGTFSGSTFRASIFPAIAGFVRDNA